MRGDPAVLVASLLAAADNHTDDAAAVVLAVAEWLRSTAAVHQVTVLGTCVRCVDHHVGDRWVSVPARWPCADVLAAERVAESILAGDRQGVSGVR